MMSASQKMVAEKLVRARKMIRKKFKALKHARADRDFFFKTKLSDPLKEILKPETKVSVMSSVDTQTSPPKLEEENDETIYDDDVFTSAKSSVSFLPTEVIAETPSRRLSLQAILSSPKLKTQLKEHLTALHGARHRVSSQKTLLGENPHHLRRPL